jgi:hypothetical protein
MPVNFLPPGFFRARVDRLIQTADQRIDQRSASFRRQRELQAPARASGASASFRRQRERVSQRFCRIPLHASILPPMLGGRTVLKPLRISQFVNLWDAATRRVLTSRD